MATDDVQAKYGQFVNDLNSGLDRSQLCAKYGLPAEKYDAFLEFLQRKGFALAPPATDAAAASTCPKCGYRRGIADASADPAVCPQCGVVYAKFGASPRPGPSPGTFPRPRPVEVDQLVYRNEPVLFRIQVVVAALYWLSLLLVTKGSFVYILPAFVLGHLIAQSALLAHLKGNGIKLSLSQFPDLYDRHLYCCTRLGVTVCPDAYVINGSGFLNAFASRFLGRDFVVLYSNVIDALKDEPEAINFYIGHELGHIKRNHLPWAPFLWPAGLLPLLGAAYSRAREYTCDQYGRACCESTESALRGLISLSAGEKLWAKVDIPAYLRQTEESSGFWMSFHELISDYPWLVKRAARVGNPSGLLPRRNALAWIPALFMPRMAVGGSASGLLVVVAIIGIFAAIAIPQFSQYRAKAQAARAAQVEMRHP